MWPLLLTVQLAQAHVPVPFAVGKIYQNDNYQNDWDGTFKDKAIPAGVYYFIVKISEEEVYTGSLTVLR